MNRTNSLPIHFFSYPVDGALSACNYPDILNNLGITWHWHIIEKGPRSPTNPTAPDCSVRPHAADKILNEDPQDRLNCCRSQASDGTNEASLPKGGTGASETGFVTTLQSTLLNIHEECLLWYIPDNTLWREEQILRLHDMFCRSPERYAAFIKGCSPSQSTQGPSSLYATAQSSVAPNGPCVWRYQPGMAWAAENYPTLTVEAFDGTPYDIALIHPFSFDETAGAGLIPEKIYSSNTQVPNKPTEHTTYLEAPKTLQAPQRSRQPIRIAIDGVFFQLNSTGIARLWYSILSCWARSGAIEHVLLLDRANTMPKIPGARYKTIAPYSIGQGEDDRQMLQDILEQENIPLFASTYYTSVVHTKTLQLVYDLIPEVLCFDIQREPAWIEKHRAFNQADFFACISENTRRDLHRFFPAIPLSASEVVYCGIDTGLFKPPSAQEVVELHHKYSITKPYFLLVGSGGGYKNAVMLVQALSLLTSQHGFEILLASHSGVPGELVDAAAQGVLRCLPLSDAELCAAYGGAVAFVYPSLYEGFGLPILEAMACNCPVITNTSASLPEVAGSAALYARNSAELAAALCEVQKPEVQQQLIQAGRKQIQLFSWERCADQLWKRVESLTDTRLSASATAQALGSMDRDSAL